MNWMQPGMSCQLPKKSWRWPKMKWRSIGKSRHYLLLAPEIPVPFGFSSLYIIRTQVIYTKIQRIYPERINSHRKIRNKTITLLNMSWSPALAWPCGNGLHTSVLGVSCPILRRAVCLGWILRINVVVPSDGDGLCNPGNHGEDRSSRRIELRDKRHLSCDNWGKDWKWVRKLFNSEPAGEAKRLRKAVTIALILLSSYNQVKVVLFRDLLYERTDRGGRSLGQMMENHTPCWVLSDENTCPSDNKWKTCSTSCQRRSWPSKAR